MNEAERIGHLLRRFGFGAGRIEAKPYLEMGFEKAKRALLHEEQVDERFPISHWEYATQDDKKVDPNAYHVGGTWALRMLLTRRPAQEKLTLFWHDHFAVDAEKVFEAPTMLSYLETLRSKGKGKFRELLHAVVKQGALISYLDNHTSNRVHPNENFARELVELFTMGEGNYTEKDVKEIARAFTGWTMHYVGLGLDVDFEKLRDRMTRSKLALFNFCYVNAIHDHGPKTILGKTAPFTGEQVLDMLANHPATIKFICGKLWRFYAGTEPTAKVLDRLGAAWKKSDGEIRTVLAAIMDSPEFWSEDCVRQLPKSPADWTVGLFRSFGWQDLIVQLRGNPTNEFTPLKKEIREAAGGLYYLMQQQGMALLFPPDVDGWEWGRGWISTDNNLHRVRHGDVIFYGGGEDRPFANWMIDLLVNKDKADTPEKLIQSFVEIFDVPLDAQRAMALVEACKKYGGMEALKNKDSAAYMFAQVAKVAFSMPEFHLC